MWPICGNGMGRLNDGMELIWALFLSNFKLWKMHGKESLCHQLYGGTMGIRCPYVFHRKMPFACSTWSMEVIWDVHIVMLHRLSIPAIIKHCCKFHRFSIWIYMESLWGRKVFVIFHSVFITQQLSKYHLLWIFYGLVTKFQWQEVPIIDSSEKYHFPFQAASVICITCKL